MAADQLTTRSAQDSSGRWKIVVFLQCLVLVVIVGAPVVRSQQMDNKRRLPDVRNNPIEILPEYDDPQVVADEQLVKLLSRLSPKFANPRPKINHVDHALRFWGIDAEFESTECLSGRQMQRMLINHSSFAEAWGERARPLLVNGDYGIAVRTALGPATASHVDHTLASLAEIGTPLDYPIETSAGTTTLKEMFEQAMLSFRLNQQEYEWTVLSLLLYAKSDAAWYTREGQQVSFDSLAVRAMRQPYSQGVCYGNHRLFTLVMMLRVNQEIPILREETERAISNFLTSATDRLIASQHADGYWDETWAADAWPLEETADEQVLSHRLLATGHALEWWAMAPEPLLPPREVIVRASQWLLSQVDSMTDEQIAANYTFLSHAGRALALWRGQIPSTFMKRQTTKSGEAL